MSDRPILTGDTVRPKWIDRTLPPPTVRGTAVVVFEILGIVDIDFGEDGIYTNSVAEWETLSE